MEDRAHPEERVGFLGIRKGANACVKYAKVAEEYKRKLFVVLVVCIFATAIGIVGASVGSSRKPEAEENEGFKDNKNTTNYTNNTTTTPDPNIITTASHPNPTTITTENATARAAIKKTSPTTSVTTNEPENPPGEVKVVGTGSSFQVDGNDLGTPSSSQKTPMIPQQLPTTRTSPKKKIQVFSKEYFTGSSETFELTEKCLPLPRRWQDRISSVNTSGECFELCTDENCNHCEKVAPGTEGHHQLRIIEGLDKRTKSMRKCQQ